MQIFNVLISFLKYVEILEQKRAAWRAEVAAHANEGEEKKEEEEEFIMVPKDVLEKFLKFTNDEEMQDTLASTSMGMEKPQGGHGNDDEEGDNEEEKQNEDKEYLIDAEQVSFY